MNSRDSFGAALGMMQQALQIAGPLAGSLLPRLQLMEAQKKLEAFRLFAYVDQELRLPAGGTSLIDMIRRAQGLPPFRRSFAFEGAAFYCASQNGSVSLADPELPANAMVPMHSGMGNALASAALAGVGQHPGKSMLIRAVDGFFAKCRENSRPGWHENAYEAIGLVVRTLHPHLLGPISEAIREIDPATERLFWHGVGRALYFVPTNFAFGRSQERALQAAYEETPTTEDRQNAVAGLAWALTMVNIEQPAVLEGFLRMCRGGTMSAAITNGIVSALMVWKHMIPEDTDTLAPYLQQSSPALWNEVVAEPAIHALSEVFPALRDATGEQPTIGSLFRYREWEVSPV